MGLWLLFHLPHLDETTSCKYRHLPKPVLLPGCVPIQGGYFLDPVQDRSNPVYKGVVHIFKKCRSAVWNMVNNFADLEPGAFKAFKEKGAVLFVSFGNGGTSSQEQLNKLTLGLELSGQIFIWVVNSPNETTNNASYFTVKVWDNPFEFLSNGFLERTKDVGLVVSSWAPQVQVLSHGSTRGFLTYCGWNSVLESIVHGATIDGLKVTFGVKTDEKGIVGSQDIAKYVRDLIEGDEGKLLRKKMEEYKEEAKLAWTEE
ncbi:unnamed protein product [Malus baccata var. baccata]